MTKASADEILMVIDNLVGEVYPVGETHIDEKRLENLKTMIEVTDGLLDRISFVANEHNRTEWSMQKAGQTALEYLADSALWFEAKKQMWRNSL